jgi:hypothetical protein
MTSERFSDSPEKPLDEAGRAELSDIAALRRDVDALRTVVQTPHPVWYENASTLIAIIALLFSFGTTFVSYRRTQSQDVQSARVELRSLLQRLTALPKENVEMMKKYESDPQTIGTIGSFINQENALLGRQAAEIIRRLPPTYVSATEYYAVASALQGAYNVDAAKEFFSKAIDLATDMNDRVAGLRSRANLLFVTG